MDKPHTTRDTILVIVLCLMIGGPCLIALDFISFGWTTAPLIALAGIGLVAAIHYLVWGRSLSEEVKEEREAEEESESDPWPPEGPHRPRGY